MQVKYIAKVIVLGASLVAGTCWAAGQGGAVEAKDVVGTLQKLYPNMKISEVKPTPFAAVNELVFESGGSVYQLVGTNLILNGELLSVNDNGLVNITEESKKVQRKEMLGAVKVSDMIVFPAQNEAKRVLTVFTDTDCGYCRKLHQQVPELNAKGVEVRYLAFPRGGVSSSTYRDLSSAWCADNKREALNHLKKSQDIPQKDCKDNPVASQYKLGGALGVTATPATVLPDGQLVMGYRAAADWLTVLGL